jgi:hypothetical protein
MVNYTTTTTEEIIGYTENGRKQVFVTVETFASNDTTGPVLTGGSVEVNLSKIGQISTVIPLPIGAAEGADTSLVTKMEGKGNTVTITVLKSDETGGTEIATDDDLGGVLVDDPDGEPDGEPAGGETTKSGVTFHFIAIGL